MKKAKKLLALLLAGAMSMSIAGCGGDSGSENGEMKTATIWMSVGHAKEFYEKKVEEFNNTKGKELGVQLNFEAKTDASYAQALDVAIQSDQLPEFFHYGDLKKLVELDRVAALSDIPEMTEFLEQFKDSTREIIHKLNGKVYSIPSGMTTRGLIYNKDMFKAAGLVDENGEPTPPKTFKEMREYAKALTGDGKYGVVFPVKWVSWVESDIVTMSNSIFGVPVYNPIDGKYDYTQLQPVIEEIMGMKEDGSVYPGAESLDNDPARARFAEGLIGMKLSYSFDVGVLNEQFPAKCDWGVAPLPTIDGTENYKQIAAVGSSIQLSKTGLEKLGGETAAEILKFLYGEEIVSDLYKQGMEIPCNYETVKDVELGEDAPKGWKEFCQLAEQSVVSPIPMPLESQGIKTIAETMINDIWPGGADIRALLEEQTKIDNDAVAKYKELHPEEDYSIYIDADWSSKAGRN